MSFEEFWNERQRATDKIFRGEEWFFDSDKRERYRPYAEEMTRRIIQRMQDPRTSVIARCGVKESLHDAATSGTP